MSAVALRSLEADGSPSFSASPPPAPRLGPPLLPDSFWLFFSNSSSVSINRSRSVFAYCSRNSLYECWSAAAFSCSFIDQRRATSEAWRAKPCCAVCPGEPSSRGLELASRCPPLIPGAGPLFAASPASSNGVLPPMIRALEIAGFFILSSGMYLASASWRSSASSFATGSESHFEVVSGAFSIGGKSGAATAASGSGASGISGGGAGGGGSGAAVGTSRTSGAVSSSLRRCRAASASARSPRLRAASSSVRRSDATVLSTFFLSSTRSCRVGFGTMASSTAATSASPSARGRARRSGAGAWAFPSASRASSATASAAGWPVARKWSAVSQTARSPARRSACRATRAGIVGQIAASATAAIQTAASPSASVAFQRARMAESGRTATIVPSTKESARFRRTSASQGFSARSRSLIGVSLLL